MATIQPTISARHHPRPAPLILPRLPGEALTPKPKGLPVDRKTRDRIAWTFAFAVLEVAAT